ncbi:SDR family oxidoreductase [Nocardia sp. CA2R105]|uniref:SDR family NAD(P)-dependent oxidoreductase n=1 Tax=Nocardia coffeae TaxID=2873381 RepID=UPI001CA600FF|nr:SDR family NAD(P)-dependent oxidoreductase [Nocardia coffeae]MBY8856843.1 SDR family oxidoreductase [Nocardia coffeae]
MTIPEDELSGKSALITGGASGIGAAIAADLTARGATVLIADIDGKSAREVARPLPGAQVIEVDLADPDSITECIDSVRTLCGGVDILINNAGLSVVQRLLNSDPASWDRMWRINLRAPMQLTQALLPVMIERGWGRMVYIATDAARVGAGGESVYAACKAGLFGLAKSVAREVAKHGITSNVLCPGLIDTPMLRNNAEANPDLLGSLLRGIPARRVGTAEEVAAYVGFLAGPDAGYVTGQTVSVSGGVTML